MGFTTKQKLIDGKFSQDLNDILHLSGTTYVNNLIIDGATTGSTNAATVEYVNNIINGLDQKDSVVLATTTSDDDIDLTGGTFIGIIDSVSVEDGWRVLIKNQTTAPEENGIYVYDSNTSTFSRSSDFNGSATITNGTYTNVISGDTLANTTWILNTVDPIEIGVTELSFTLFSKLLEIAQGNGISITSQGVTKTIAISNALNDTVTGLTETVGTLNDTVTGLTETVGTLNDTVTGLTEVVITGATNGLTKTGKIVELGGDLTKDTDINIQQNKLNFKNFSPKFLLDENFNFGDSGSFTGVTAVDVQSDGKIIVGGYFTEITGNTGYTGSSFNRIMRLNQDGTIDDTFDVGSGFNEAPSVVKLQSDGKIIVGGYFTTYKGTSSKYIIRLNSDGSIDNTFAVGTGFNTSVRTIYIDSNNKIVVGGDFTSYKGVTANRIIRLNTDGSIDSTFNSVTRFNGGGDIVETIYIDSNNKIVVGGNFTSYSGVTANRIIRLENDGSIDYTFTGGTGFNSYVDDLVLQLDGKIVVGGSFTSYSGITANRIIRLENDGSIDYTFTGGTGFGSLVKAITIQLDGKIVVGGNFTSYSGVTANSIIRLNSDGSIDDTDVDFDLLEFNNRTINYSSDYSTFYNDRSLVDKAFVLSQISSSTSNIIPTISVVTTNTTLVGDEKIVICNSATPLSLSLPSSPSTTISMKIKDGYGDALNNNITISGNGKNIEGNSDFIINTNYGGVELIFSTVLDEWFVLNINN